MNPLLAIIVRKEILGHLLSLRFWVVFILFVGLTPTSLWILTRDYREARQLYQASRDLHWETLSSIQNIQSLREQADVIGDYGIYAGVPPQPLSLFVSGVKDILPYQVHACGNFTREIFKEDYQNPVFALFPTPDYGYLVNTIVSLMALLIVFGAISGEKERGTLRLMMTHAVPRHILLLGKWMGGYIALGAPFLMALFGGATLVYLTGVVSLSSDLVIRLVGITGVSLLYLALFFSFGLMISALTHRASTALLIVLFVWAGWNLVVPNLSPVIARVMAPAPSAPKLKSEKENIRWSVRAQNNRINRTPGLSSAQKQRLKDDFKTKAQRRKQALDQDYQNKTQRQTTVSQMFSRLSPSACFRYAVAELAGTGTGYVQKYREAAIRFKQDYTEFDSKIWSQLRDKTLSEVQIWLRRDKIPTLQIHSPSLDETLGAIYLDVFLLFAYTVVFFSGAWGAFLKYDTR